MFLCIRILVTDGEIYIAVLVKRLANGWFKASRWLQILQMVPGFARNLNEIELEEFALMPLNLDGVHYIHQWEI